MACRHKDDKSGCETVGERSWRTDTADESDFEGTLVLERLAVIEKIDEFFEAIDSDDVETAKRLMKAAKIDSATIAIVLRKMAESDGNHSH